MATARRNGFRHVGTAFKVSRHTLNPPAPFGTADAAHKEYTIEVPLLWMKAGRPCEMSSGGVFYRQQAAGPQRRRNAIAEAAVEIGRASCRERV